MKRIISLLLCLCMLVPLLSGCELTVSLKDGVEGKTSDGGEKDSVNTGGDLNVSAPKAGDILAIAKKYYDFHSKAIDSSLKSELSGDVGAVGFDGELNDADKAENLCSLSALTAALRGDGDYAVAGAAAAVGWSHGYARSAGTLAAVLQQAGFVADTDRLNDAKKLAEYAISLDKEDIDLYITLAHIRNDLGDIDGALEAIEAALALDPGNYSALMMKLQLTLMKGGLGGGNSEIIIDPEDIGKKIKENDGELSKRDTEQEEAAKYIEGPKDEDSKEVLRGKFDEICELEPITPADMVEILFPDEAKQLRQKIITVTSEQKNLCFPEFPGGLFNNAKEINVDGEEAARQYLEWLRNLLDNITTIELPKLFNKSVVAAQNNPRTYGGTTAADYMLEYNQQVCSAVSAAYVNYCDKLVEVHQVEIVNYTSTLSDKISTAAEAWAAEMEAIEKMPTATEAQIEAKQAARIACDKKNKNNVNSIYDSYVQSVLSLTFDTYSDMTQMGQELWDNMVPYARCTAYPEGTLYNLYSIVVPMPISILNAGLSACLVPYYDDVTYADVVKAQQALEEAVRISNTKFVVPDAALPGVIISVTYGPLEFKLSSSSVELEYVAGVAGRVAYDWKKDQMEIGMGAGGKLSGFGMKSGFDEDVSSGQIEGKAYINFVFQTRKGRMSTAEVCDIYVSGELKASGSAGSMKMEGGFSGRLSLTGNGASGIDAAVKKTAAGLSAEHVAEIIQSE